jgi:hypothetical protein
MVGLLLSNAGYANLNITADRYPGTHLFCILHFIYEHVEFNASSYGFVNFEAAHPRYLTTGSIHSDVSSLFILSIKILMYNPEL